MMTDRAANHKAKPYSHDNQSGNVFFIVMVAVALFAGLMFTFSRGARQGGDNLTHKQSEISAADILNYAQSMERAVARVYGRGFSENAISFENDITSDFDNPHCTQSRCRVFHPDGGGIRFDKLDQKWSRSTEYWHITGDNRVIGIGTDCSDSSCSDLLMVIEDVPLTLCAAINKRLALPTPMPENNNLGLTPFTGSFGYTATDRIGIYDDRLEKTRTACFQHTNNNYYFYHVILER